MSRAQRVGLAMALVKLVLLAALASALWKPLPTHANAPTPSAAPTASADPALEARVLKLSAELRCLVCQNQTIADSNADLAVDLRNQVREMLKRGESPQQVIDFMTARYGDFVLYRPPVKSTTMLLWYGPIVLLVVAALTFVLLLRRRSRLAADQFEPDPEDIKP
jgi:cytochrome c-type biogenesis protein CcmH